MAEAATSSQTSTPAAPAHPPEPLPEPDLDALLSHIPAFKEVFGTPAESGETKPESTEPTPEAEEATEGLDPAIPLEEETPEVEAEPEPEPEPEPKPEPDSVQRRIDKLTAARKTAEEKAAALETELADLKSKYQAPPPLAPTPQSPLAHIETAEQLQRQFELSRTAKSWAIQHLDGGEVDLGDGNTKFLNGDQVKLLLSRAEDMLTSHIPQRQNYLVSKTDFDNQAKKAYPTLFKAGHKDQAEYNSWLTVFPECRRYPDIALIVGDAIVGRNMRLQKAAGAQKGKAAVNGNGQTPLAVPAPAAQPRVPRTRALSGAELSAIATDPSGSALDAFVSQLIDTAAQSRAQRSSS
jgi:hypothetical protein